MEKQYVLTDLSFMKDKNLNYCPVPTMYGMSVKVIETGLKIPGEMFLGKQIYLDTKIQYKNKIYYTLYRFLKEIEKIEYNNYEIEDWDQFLDDHNFIGFIPRYYTSKYYKYMIVVSGTARGFAVRPSGTWSFKENQDEQRGTYYIFKTKNELLEWMKDKN